jgi:hypothetical protein
MSENEPSPPLNENATTVESNFHKIFNSSRNTLTQSITEWLPSLIDQPTNPPFKRDALFVDEFSRIAGLLVIVVILSTIIISSVSFVFGGIIEGATVVGTTVMRIIRLSLSIIIAVFLISLIYHPVAYISGVKISKRKKLSLRQIFLQLCIL